MVRIWNVRICGGFPVLPATPGFMHANLSISEIYKLPEIWTKAIKNGILNVDLNLSHHKKYTTKKVILPT